MSSVQLTLRGIVQFNFKSERKKIQEMRANILKMKKNQTYIRLFKINRGCQAINHQKFKIKQNNKNSQ